jgi:hypothetical protein
VRGLSDLAKTFIVLLINKTYRNVQVKEGTIKIKFIRLVLFTRFHEIFDLLIKNYFLLEKR